jgi:thiosulfate/3-mercaptopyruvate sulfurtransferase
VCRCRPEITKEAAMTEYLHPEAIVSTDWLAGHLDDPDVRIFESTVFLHHVEEGPDAPYRVESGRAAYATGHIPGAAFIDIPGDFSDRTAPTHFTMPPADQFAAVAGRAGLGDGCHAVVYARGNKQWATRLWWMLRAMGFDRASVLDGGFEKWRAEARPTSTASAAYPAATFTPRPRPELFVGKEAVAAAMGDPKVCTINALLPELHRGDSKRYGRAGHIPGSVNLPCGTLLDPATNTFLPPEAAKARLEAIGATPDRKAIVYCGGGIAATLDAFIMYQLGYPDIAVYDASMSEWAKDLSLPVEVG